MNWINKLAWIAINNRSVLSTKSYGKDKYYIPGGKRENGESDEQALCREIKEELCIELDKGTLQLLGVFEAHAHGHPPDTFVRMTCYTATYTGTIKAGAEIEETCWLNYTDKINCSAVDNLVFEFLKESGLLD